ncbi:unnamed protein product [Durusdinium trenchii]|uniref:Capsular polysaccharide synthesis protein n=2 Tax=Durusdinium trenchii TaxID=1381693 RepID=A0ABP0NEZ2_9DINO
MALKWSFALAAGRAEAASLRRPSRSPTPRIAWSFWDKGAEKLPDFRRLCVETWAAQNPDWEIEILDQRNVLDFLEPSDLPRLWDEMYVPWQADAVRLALLAKYGGLWIDASTICFQPFDAWIYGAIQSEERPEEIAAFYFSAWGCEMHKSKEFVENWVMAARREHPLMLAWQALFNGYWNSKSRADAFSMFLDPPGVPEHPLFRDVDLSHLKRFGQDLRNYLLMHAAFKKMIDQYPEFRRIWEEEMLLIRADDTAFWHMEEPDVKWDPNEFQPHKLVAKLVFPGCSAKMAAEDRSVLDGLCEKILSSLEVHKRYRATARWALARGVSDGKGLNELARKLTKLWQGLKDLRDYTRKD